MLSDRGSWTAHRLCVNTLKRSCDFELITLPQEMSESLSALFSGSFAGACSTFVGAPFDTVKVRLQTNASHFRSLNHCFTKTVREESFLSLYKGVYPAMTSAVLENSTVFFANSLIKEAIYVSTGRASTELSLKELACIGGLAGVFSATAICPAETLKCQHQAQLSTAATTARTSTTSVLKYSTWNNATLMVQREGISGLFRGLPAQLARDIPFNFVFFGGYECACHLFCYMKAQNMNGVAEENMYDHSKLSSIECVLAGGVAGVLGWTVTLPMDTVKSVVQASKEQIAVKEAVFDLWKKRGLKGFYKGYSAAVLRAFPANGALFLAYEVAENAFRLRPEQTSAL